LNRLGSLAELEKLRKSIVSKKDPKKPCVIICGGTGCLALAAAEVISAFNQEVEAQGLVSKVDIRVTGCPGFCERGPLVVVEPENIFYQRVKPSDVAEIVSETVGNNKVVERLLYVDPETGQRIVHESEIPFYVKQKRLLLGNNSLIDPENIEDYLALGGYSALSKVLSDMSPEEIIEEVKKSGLSRSRDFAGVAVVVSPLAESGRPAATLRVT